jgi:hypothetical protein
VKVWVVRDDDWESQSIMTVCATAELAEVERLMLEQDYRSWAFEVEEFEVLDDIVKRKTKQQRGAER